ncbi:hypothetical protein [Microbacterium sp. 77mftsu3.1]|uniref:hypothetical protein n=1 Tax=Microbacterium sp. 77mftsu3.1 TaxID=1761802 RepID=UPI00038222CF|nr:hypothetical protein [Microbacterium sp. 77mftsu3.1]SDH54098.1 hypothetical protein SAMN04488590_3521 [Microbacterium sp. 77mftsu3.1]
MANAITPITVAVGQVREDNDERSRGRTVRIVGIDETHASVVVLTARSNAPADVKKRVPGKRTRIRLDRLKPTGRGYRLITPAL